MTFSLAFFGFYRNGDKMTYNFDVKSNEYKKYIYTPTINNEDTANENSKEKFLNKFGENSQIVLYEYDKQIHIDKCSKIHKGKFINKWYQQGYRIFSFFYNIKGVLNMIKKDSHEPNDIILLCRIDIGLNINNKNKIYELLKLNDVLLVGKSGPVGTQDKLFIFKYKHIDIFINLYDDYEKYIYDNLNNIDGCCISTRPEDIFYFHFKKYKLKCKFVHNLVSYLFKHVCSKYCGHHGKKTKT